MDKSKERYLRIVDEIVKLINDDAYGILNEAYFRTISVLENLYGKKDARISYISSNKASKYDSSPNSRMSHDAFKYLLLGTLSATKKDIEHNLIENIEKKVAGAVLADLLVLARQCADEGYKDVAAVLAAASLEDSLKKYATSEGLDVGGKEMSEVINSLKAKELLQGGQASLLSSFLKIRNKAFHAEWEKLDLGDIKSLISFSEEFILKRLAG